MQVICQLHKLGALSMGKEPLLASSLVGCVGYSGVLDVLQKGKAP